MISNERLYLNNNRCLLREAVDPSDALKIREKSNAHAILYGWKYKGEEVEIAPEEHTPQSLERRLNQIVSSMSVYSQNNPRGNRYAYHRDFIFYILYNDKPYGITTNESMSKFKCVDCPTTKLFEGKSKSKKGKKKNKKSKMQNSPVFSSINDLLKWVKKRQKGLPALSTFNPNAGNVEYNCAFFNHAMGSDGGSMSAMQGALSSGGGDAGVSSGGDAGGGMGECLHNTQKEIKNLLLPSALNERVQLKRRK